MNIYPVPSRIIPSGTRLIIDFVCAHAYVFYDVLACVYVRVCAYKFAYMLGRDR